MKLSRLKSVIIEIFRQKKGVIAVLLYGSRAKGTARSDSDVDIAILYEHAMVPSFLELLDLKQQLEETLQCDVDLICLNDVGLIISSQVYKYHQSLLINDQKKLDQYFMHLVVEYAELKEFRRPMEENILERKYYDRS